MSKGPGGSSPTTTTTTTVPCTTKYTSVTLSAGESYILPPGATIISATDPSALTSVNDCFDPSTLETPVCYEFAFGRDADNNDDHPMDSAYIQSLYLGGNQGTAYDINTNIMGSCCTGSSQWAPGLASKFANNVPLVVEYLGTSLIGCFGSGFLTNDKRCEYRVRVKTIPSIGKDMWMYLGGKGFPNGLWIAAQPVGC